MPNIRITAYQTVQYDKTVEVSEEEAAELLASQENGDDLTLLEFANEVLEWDDIWDTREFEDIEVDLVKEDKP